MATSTAAVWVTVTREGGELASDRFELRRPAFRPGLQDVFKIGRSSKQAMFIPVPIRGVSTNHAELRLLVDPTLKNAQLLVRDSSMNGTGLKKPARVGKKESHTEKLEKDKFQRLPSGSDLLIPWKLTASQCDSLPDLHTAQTDSTNSRCTLKVEFGWLEDTGVSGAPAAPNSARPPPAGGAPPLATAGVSAPRAVDFISPSGNQEFTGHYVLVPGMMANGYPVWKQDVKDNWMYSGMNEGKWILSKGTSDIGYGKSFKIDFGYISTSDRHRGAMPNCRSLVGGWEWYDLVTQDWREDTKIVCKEKNKNDVKALAAKPKALAVGRRPEVHPRGRVGSADLAVMEDPYGGPNANAQATEVIDVDRPIRLVSPSREGSPIPRGLGLVSRSEVRRREDDDAEMEREVQELMNKDRLKKKEENRERARKRSPSPEGDAYPGEEEDRPGYRRFVSRSRSGKRRERANMQRMEDERKRRRQRSESDAPRNYSPPPPPPRNYSPLARRGGRERVRSPRRSPPRRRR